MARCKEEENTNTIGKNESTQGPARLHDGVVGLVLELDVGPPQRRHRLGQQPLALGGPRARGLRGGGLGQGCWLGSCNDGRGQVCLWWWGRGCVVQDLGIGS